MYFDNWVTLDKKNCSSCTATIPSNIITTIFLMWRARNYQPQPTFPCRPTPQINSPKIMQRNMSRGSPSSSSSSSSIHPSPFGKLSSGRTRKGNTLHVHGAQCKWGISSWQRGIQFEFIVYFPGRLHQKILEKLLKYLGAYLLSVFEFATESQRKWMSFTKQWCQQNVKLKNKKLYLFAKVQQYVCY